MPKFRLYGTGRWRQRKRSKFCSRGYIGNSSSVITLFFFVLEEGVLYKIIKLPSLYSFFDASEDSQNGHTNVTVLVYTISNRYEDALRDLRFEGNFRQECSLQFDCIFKQNHNHKITSDLFYSMDAVVVGFQAVHNLRQFSPNF